MIHFANDYGSAAHPAVIDKIASIAGENFAGYGLDRLSERVCREILDKCGLSDGMVHLLIGGTQTNAVALDWLLRPGQGVLCTREGHINVHEAGAIERAGHKVIPVTDSDKIMADDVEQYMSSFYADVTWPHMVCPGVVYISQPTELGSVYTRRELEELRDVCRKHELKLYADGARLVYALAADGDIPDLADMGRLTDAFYIGGTKGGTLFGEALVIPGTHSDRERKRLFSMIKSHGALLAKGWLTAAQFDALICDNLYVAIGNEALRLAKRLSEELPRRGVRLWRQSPTNQQFFVVDNNLLSRLDGEVSYDVWGNRGVTETVIRLATSWVTTDTDVDRVVTLLSE